MASSATFAAHLVQALADLVQLGSNRGFRRPLCDYVVAEVDALVTDVDATAGYQPLHLALFLPQNEQRTSSSVAL